MTTSTDPAGQALARLVATLSEDAVFVLASCEVEEAAEALDAFAKRRAESYAASMQGTAVPRMGDRFDMWVAEATRAIAPVTAPAWLPMGDLLRAKVTLEVGARGFRSLFSSKPSDKDVQRVKRLGTLAVRVLRAVYASDGPVDAEDERAITLLVGALGLSHDDAAPLLSEAPVEPGSLELYGEIDPDVARGIVHGAWLAAASDAIDPREEDAVRVVATKLGVADEALESARADAVQWVDARKALGQATTDAIRYVLADRVPGEGIELAAKAGTLLLPRGQREETLAQVAHGAPVVLAKRHSLPAGARQTALAVTWACALHEDPTLGRRALLRARFERVAQDLGGDAGKARALVDRWLDETLASSASSMR